MTFTFRFSGILQLRRQERDQAAVALAHLDQAINHVDQRRQSIDRRRESLREAQRHLGRGVISVHELKSQTDFDDALRHADAQLSLERETLESELRKAHNQLIAAQQEVAKLEKLQQLEQSRQQAKRRHREQRSDDAINAVRHSI